MYINYAKLVGTVFCVGVIGMYHSGIGGGGFMIVRGSNGSYEFIDFREKAPAAAFQVGSELSLKQSVLSCLENTMPVEVSWAFAAQQIFFPQSFTSLHHNLVDARCVQDL